MAIFDEQKKTFFQPVSNPTGRPDQARPIQRRASVRTRYSPDYGFGQQQNTSQFSDLANEMLNPANLARGVGKNFSRSERNARIGSRRMQNQRLLAKMFSNLEDTGIRQEGANKIAAMRNANELAGIRMREMGANERTVLQEMGANTRADKISQAKDQNVNVLTPWQRGNLLADLGKEYEKNRLLGNIPKDEKGNLIDINTWLGQINKPFYNLLNSTQQETENISGSDPEARGTITLADGTVLDALPSSTDLYKDTIEDNTSNQSLIELTPRRRKTIPTNIDSQITSGGQVIPSDIAATKGSPSFLQSLMEKGRSMTPEERALKEEERRKRLSQTFNMGQ